MRCAPGTGLAAYDASPVTGRISDARERVQEVEGGPALDAVLIGSLQKTEQYYCIAAWGTARSLAESARESDVEMYGARHQGWASSSMSSWPSSPKRR